MDYPERPAGTREPGGLLTTPFPMITLCALSHEEQRDARVVAAKKKGRRKPPLPRREEI